MTNKERAYLTGLAAKEPSILSIGKASLTPEVTASIAEALEARELVKISVQKSVDADLRDLAETLAGRTRSAVVRVIGRRIILYKKGKKPKISFPGPHKEAGKA